MCSLTFPVNIHLWIKVQVELEEVSSELEEDSKVEPTLLWKSSMRVFILTRGKYIDKRSRIYKTRQHFSYTVIRFPTCQNVE